MREREGRREIGRGEVHVKAEDEEGGESGREREEKVEDDVGFAEVETRATRLSVKHHLTYTTVVVAVDHDGGPSVEIHVEVPPICYVIGSPPGLQVQVALHLLTRTILNVT